MLNSWVFPNTGVALKGLIKKPIYHSEGAAVVAALTVPSLSEGQIGLLMSR